MRRLYSRAATVGAILFAVVMAVASSWWWLEMLQRFTGLPNFAPEILRRVQLKDPTKTKQLRKALDDMAEEGVTQVFYPETDEEAEQAKSVCAVCPVQGACLEYALTRREKEGVWGGCTERERRRIIRQRRRTA